MSHVNLELDHLPLNLCNTKWYHCILPIFCSSVKACRTHLACCLQTSGYLCRISCSGSAPHWSMLLWLVSTLYICSFCIFCGSAEVTGWPVRVSSSRLCQPLLNSLYHLNTVAPDEACLQKVGINFFVTPSALTPSWSHTHTYTKKTSLWSCPGSTTGAMSEKKPTLKFFCLFFLNEKICQSSPLNKCTHKRCYIHELL